MVVEEENQPKIAPNRMKFEEILEEEKEDRISALPDCLIHEILSRLPFTKEAIRTGTLSKRWEHLWTFLPVLIFSRYNNGNPRWPNFVSFVDKTLTKCRHSKLKKFQVHAGSYDIGFESQVNNWISYAIKCNVEDLHLLLGGPFLADQNLFTSSCFTDLRLSGCILNPTGAISWKNLRSLSIFHGKLDEDLIENILSGSPLLETLELYYCYIYQMLHVTSKGLKKLVLCGCMASEIDISYDIQFVSQVNNWIRFAIRCNVEELNLEFWNMKIADKYQLDQNLFIGSCFTDLSLTIEGCILNPIGAISWKNLIAFVKVDEDLIENILRGSPELETLVLNNCYGYRRLDITSKSVKNLVLCGYMGPGSDHHIIEINAANILSLTIKHSLYLWNLVLLDVSSLVKAYLNYTKNGHYETTYKEAEEEMLQGFVLNLHNVKELKIGAKCSSVMSRLEAKRFVSPSNIKFLQSRDM